MYWARKNFGKKPFLVFSWTFSTDKRAPFTKIEFSVLFLFLKVHNSFAFLNAGGDSNEEDLRYFYLHQEIMKSVDSVTWDEEFSNPLSVAYETFLQNTISELVRLINTLFLSIDCLGIYQIDKGNF